METDEEGDTSKLVRWGALHESPIFNRNASQAKKKKELIKQFYAENGPGSSRRVLPGRHSAQGTSGRLIPPCVLEVLEETQSPDQIVATCAASDNPWDFAKTRSYLTPNYLRRATLKIGLKKRIESDREPPSAGTSRLPSRQSDTSSLASDSSTPLPTFPRRPPTEMLLYRRPTIERAIPLKVDETLFAFMANKIDLKQLPFKRTSDALKFYERSFPLLLTKMAADMERCGTPTKRSRTPESPTSMMIARKRLLNQRLVDLEAMVIDMARTTEDVTFVTELSDPVFDPTSWPWNVFTVQSLRRRYTIDASLQEM